MSMNEDDLLRDLAMLKEGGAENLIARALADAAFEDAKRSRPVPSDRLMARISGDARKVAQGRRWRDRAAWAGLAAACAAGIAIGFVDPGGLIGGATEYALEDLSGGYEFQFAGVME